MAHTIYKLMCSNGTDSNPAGHCDDPLKPPQDLIKSHPEWFWYALLGPPAGCWLLLLLLPLRLPLRLPVRLPVLLLVLPVLLPVLLLLPQSLLMLPPLLLQLRASRFSGCRPHGDANAYGQVCYHNASLVAFLISQVYKSSTSQH